MEPKNYCGMSVNLCNEFNTMHIEMEFNINLKGVDYWGRVSADTDSGCPQPQFHLSQITPYPEEEQVRDDIEEAINEAYWENKGEIE